MDQTVNDGHWKEHAVTHFHATPLGNVSHDMMLKLGWRLLGDGSTTGKVGKLAHPRELRICWVEENGAVDGPAEIENDACRRPDFHRGVVNLEAMDELGCYLGEIERFGGHVVSNRKEQFEPEGF